MAPFSLSTHSPPPPAFRCKVCEACTQTTGSSSRRCLLVRATAAAAAGHVGAQLSVLGDKAVGADIEVWWPLDQAWYKGVVSFVCVGGEHGSHLLLAGRGV